MAEMPQPPGVTKFDLNFKRRSRDQGPVPHRRGWAFLGTSMQSVRPDNTDPIPLRQSQQSVTTILIRFVGLLAAATVVMVLIWNR
ncbi:hypothetical protein JQ604_39805 [Bradyrhizobium jicamae]|uniref:hypothetical protein n=1 Tax=Bradyrhizobium jicamae TaxID=280332 RepID=UPI001BAA5856|nr:hypothetical protein [Bradyrhizobium jicamae]MBR0758360.1 hypothetical protein [Bradyrhizobium jicamae]